VAERTLRVSVFWFACKFIAIVAVLMPLWWLFLPYFAEFLLQVSGILLKIVFNEPVEAGRIDSAGFLNTETLLTFVIDGRDLSMPIAVLVANVPPFIALVLATAGLGWKRCLKTIVVGCAILIAGHIAFLVLALEYREAKNQEIPTAIVQFFMTLPFLLWLVLAYWDRLMAYLAEDLDDAENGAE